jgi:succinate dehydrogenase / fumarate reductase cytochrome b subunit
LATAHNPARPLSPHLQVWKWGPHMLVSILHRVTGSGMATVGTVVLVWWLAAAASGKEAYATFLDTFTLSSGGLNIVGYVLFIGLSWAFFQHLANGIRHLFMDAGANFELKANKTSAVATMIFSGLATIALWAYLLVGR